MSSLPELRQAVLAVNDTMTNDQVLEVRERLIFTLGDVKEMVKELDTALIDWMNANGDLRINDDKHLYVGHDKRTKCNDVAATLEALFVTLDGDFGGFADCLSSNAFKHGTCRRPLGEAWEKHFTETIVDKVKVKEADAKFARKPKEIKP